MTLTDLFNKYKTDRGDKKVYSDMGMPHNYGPFYDKIFSPIRNNNLILLEVGLFWRGEDINNTRAIELGPRSLFAWKEYFTTSKIIGADILCNENIISEWKQKGYSLYFVDQDNNETFNCIKNDFNNFDIIIDDAAHKTESSFNMFLNLFPVLNTSGHYFIEDLFPGDPIENMISDYIKNTNSVMNIYLDAPKRGTLIHIQKN